MTMSIMSSRVLFASLISLLLSVIHVQAQFSIAAPAAGATITPGQNLNVQIIVPIDTSAFAGQTELLLTIGIVSCPSPTPCPAPSTDLGEFIFIGKYQSQGQAPPVPNHLNSFANFALTVPGDLAVGRASVQVQHSFVLTPPGHALPTVEYTSVQVQVGSGGGGGTTGTNINIHPNGDTSKCIGILAGMYADGSAVDIYDCNASPTQKWQWAGTALQSINPADGSKWCLDAGLQSTWTNGAKMKIWHCLPNLPQQSWSTLSPGTSGVIKLAAPNTNFCLDLTNGAKFNQNVLQIWGCGGGNANQVWSVVAV